MDKKLQFIIGGWVIAAVGTLIANVNVQEGEEGGMREWVMTLVIAAVVALVLYLILTRVPSSDTTALVLGILAILTFAVFWLGIMPVFAGAAAGVALSGGTDGRSVKATAALVLAALAIIGFLVLVFIG